jgi:hypothetical protein
VGNGPWPQAGAPKAKEWFARASEDRGTVRCDPRPRPAALAEPLRVGGQGQGGRGGRFEQQFENRGSVIEGETVQLTGQGEDDVKIVNGQNALQTSLDPSSLPERLAFWTMPVSARVVGWPLEATGGAEVKMPAQRSRPARDEIAHDGLLARGQGVELAIFVEVAAKDVRHLERRRHHRHTRRASGMRRHS